jgi:hypothetical protein
MTVSNFSCFQSVHPWAGLTGGVFPGVWPCLSLVQACKACFSPTQCFVAWLSSRGKGTWSHTWEREESMWLAHPLSDRERPRGNVSFVDFQNNDPCVFMVKTDHISLQFLVALKISLTGVHSTCQTTQHSIIGPSSYIRPSLGYNFLFSQCFYKDTTETFANLLSLKYKPKILTLAGCCLSSYFFYNSLYV